MWLKAIENETTARKSYLELVKDDRCESEVLEDSKELLPNRSEASLYKRIE
jgi:hypothetical protein